MENSYTNAKTFIDEYFSNNKELLKYSSLITCNLKLYKDAQQYINFSFKELEDAVKSYFEFESKNKDTELKKLNLVFSYFCSTLIERKNYSQMHKFVFEFFRKFYRNKSVGNFLSRTMVITSNESKENFQHNVYFNIILSHAFVEFYRTVKHRNPCASFGAQIAATLEDYINQFNEELDTRPVNKYLKEIISPKVLKGAFWNSINIEQILDIIETDIFVFENFMKFQCSSFKKEFSLKDAENELKDAIYRFLEFKQRKTANELKKSLKLCSDFILYNNLDIRMDEIIEDFKEKTKSLFLLTMME